MKEQYFFGYFYIKASKFLAFLTIIVGLAIAVSLLFDWKKTMNEKKYVSNPILATSLTRLVNDYENTKKEALELRQRLMATETTKVELNKDPSFFKTYRTPEEFDDLQEQVDNIQKNSDILKELVFKSFDGSINYLLNKMKRHAQEKGWLTETAKKAETEEEKKEEESNEVFRLFNASDFRELGERKKALDEGIDYLNLLLRDAVQDDSRNNIERLTGHLNTYLNILNAVNAGLPNAPEIPSVGIDVDSRKRVFDVMERLTQLKSSVRDVVFRSWTLDHQYEKTSQLIQEEMTKCLKSQEEVKQTLASYSFSLCWAVLISLAVTIFILVSSDMLKAVFQLLSKKP